MSANHSLVLFEGDVTSSFPGIFNLFGLKMVDGVERATGLAEIWEFTNWPRKGKPRNRIHKAALYNGMWTAILDREMTMILDTEKCEECAKKFKIKIFGYMVESVSGSCAMYYFAPDKIRGLNIQNFKVLENVGEPLPQEEGITEQDMLSEGAMRISRRIGFADSLFAHPTSRVMILGMEDPRREAADQERSGMHSGAARQSGVEKGKKTGIKRPEIKKPENHVEKPWWRLW